ncbi:DUF362 domain-containing protein [Halosimplex halobium]|uniref:DUF362 domain-containing protein n=1 Tax=Halosimplex halobium TaxID=3396618 RepID=UPI003F549BDE
MKSQTEDVTVFQFDKTSYPEEPPFHPSDMFSEYPFGETVDEPNPIYDGVRETFRQAGLDEPNMDSANWNPLSDVLEPDDDVVLKPNFVKESHPRDPDGWKYVLTHGSVIRAVADYVFKALGDEGSVVVADAPHTDSSFNAICDVLGMYDIEAFYSDRGLDFSLVDLRKEEWETNDGVVMNRRDLEGDPRGYSEFDLANGSEFADHGGEGHYYGADFDKEQVNYHHRDGRHEYLLASTPISADVVFSLPKLKTHKKAGITVTLKNLVGINGDKNYLPHHTEPGDGHPGDEHPDPSSKHQIEQLIAPLFIEFANRFPKIGPRVLLLAKKAGKPIFGGTEEVIRQGNWWGNDTTWRMCLDLNKLLFYGNTDGSIREADPENRKRHYSLVDGVIAGEGRGPMDPDPVNTGLFVFGTHPASVDASCAYLMGFDPDKIPIVRQSFRCESYTIAEWDWTDIKISSNREAWSGPLPDIPVSTTLDFKPHFGWTDHIKHGDNISGSEQTPRSTLGDD